MKPEGDIVNRVASSSLVVFELDHYYVPGERIVLDVKDLLHEGLILREKDLRDFVAAHDWKTYAGKHVAVTCSADAIIPAWAYMLLATGLEPHAATVVYGDRQALEAALFAKRLAGVDWAAYEGARVVVKGCSKADVPPATYTEIALRLRAHVQSLMFGEPCSTVPVFKRPRRG